LLQSSLFGSYPSERQPEGQRNTIHPFGVGFPEKVEKYENRGNCIHFIGKFFSFILKRVCLGLE